jgi:hypothetical protein
VKFTNVILKRRKQQLMKRFRKILAYIAVIVIIIAAGLIAYGFKGDLQQSIEYSAYNVEGYGTRALYLLSKEMGYDVEVFTKPSRFLPDNAIVVAIEPQLGVLENPLEKKYFKAWLDRGNVLVLMSYGNDIEDYIEELGAKEPSHFGRYDQGYKYSVGDGSIIFFTDSEKYTNSGVKDLELGVQFIEALEEAKFKKVLFNDYFHGIGSGSTKLWDILGFSGKLVIIQMALCLLIFMFIASRRFGKPLVVFETIKRMENENLFALSNIYYKSKANAMALDIYLEGLKQELAKFLGFGREGWSDKDLVKAAQTDNTLKDLEVEAVFLECENYINNKKNDGKVLLKLYKRLELIRKGIK